MRRLITLLGITLMSAGLSIAQSVVDTLRIDVELRDNGDAVISETWSIDVDNKITEWYLVLGNLGDMHLGDLRVTDETGLEFYNEGEWDLDRDRAQKAGRCGVVSKSDSYELCWGVGSSGPHIYTVTYTLSGFVKGHSDRDGFNHMFVASDLGSLPDHIELRMYKKDAQFSPSNSSVWGFGFKGEAVFEDGEIVARTDGAFTKQSRMIVMAGFDKEIFTPSVNDESMTFGEIQEKALSGSDYSESGESGWLSKLLTFLILGSLAAIPFGKAVSDKKLKNQLLGGSEKEVAWFRSVPVDGSLKRAYTILSIVGPSSSDKANIVAAYITRLLYRKALTIVRDIDGKSRIKVMPYPDGERFVDRDLGIDLEREEMDNPRLAERDQVSEQGLHRFLQLAAGEDGVLQEKELSRWLKKNDYLVYTWITALKDKESNLKNLNAKEVREVFGLKRFLKDFTLIEDRGAVEIGLWNNYLVFASLYGIADQLIKDFKKVCPEYFEMSRVAASLDDPFAGSVWSDIDRISRSINSASDSYLSRSSASSARSSGGGGRSSFGGGGGFSGGGSGGGGR